MRSASTLVLALIAALSLGTAGAGWATIGTLDEVPAATLLLPYFEVDPADPDGVTTLFTVRNASAGPVVAHVTLWSNLSVPVLDFDVYLTGYDSQAVNLRDVFVEGVLPVTAPDDAFSPRGPRSKPHDDLGGSCNLFLPYTNPALLPAFRDHLEASLTGQPSLLFRGECAGAPTQQMVGYITIDAVNVCNLDFPSNPGYFEPGGTGTASNRNVLWGEWLIADPGDDFAQGDALVHIEASGDDPLTATPGNRTFYGRYVGGSAADNREPLSSTWHAPLGGGALPGGETELLVWRDSGIVQTSFPCGGLPAPFPLATGNSSFHDESGAATPFPADALPWETQRLEIAPTGGGLDLSLDAVTGSPFDPDQQGHVTVIHSGSGLFSTGAGAVQGEPGALSTPDAAPGASLLLPYFEVDPTEPALRTTTATVHNASADPVLAHAVLWTDLGVPTLGFDVHLPAHGSRVVDLGVLFGAGAFPASGPAALPGCAGRLPPAPLSATELEALRAAHAGAASDRFEGRCAGHDHGDALARGYLTLDVVTSCTGAVPGETGYFGVLAFDNALWGDALLRDAGNDFAHGDSLVHLQASTTDPATGAGQPTFYGRYTAPGAADHREALPRRWATEYRMGAVFDAAEHLVWRDPGTIVEPFDCGSDPQPFPVGQGVSLRFDEDGFDGTLPSPAAELATQGTGVPQPTVPGGFGWLFLDLDAWTGGSFGTRLQSHVTGVSRVFGRFSTSSSAVHLPLAFGTAVGILATDPEAAERSAGDPSTPDPGEIVLGRTGALDQPLEVLLSISGTAVEGTDYDPLQPSPVTIPAGASTLAMPVVPILDGVSDDGETVVLTIQPGLGYGVDLPSSATVTILEQQPEPGGPSDVLEIPTLGPWGLALLALLLLGAGVALAKR